MMNNEERDKMLIEIHSAVHKNTGLIQRHDKTLYGNGRPGLCTAVEKLINDHINEERVVINNEKSVASVIAIVMAACSIAGTMAAIATVILT